MGKNETNTLNRKEYFIVFLILIIGILVRTIAIDIFPAGLNQDEASSAYDAFAIMNYGIDRNGVFNPVHLIAWGSGQNTAYAWLTMPFIAVFGLNVLSIRLPMAIISSICLLCFYGLLKITSTKKAAMIGTFIFAIAPWHIMKSRWSLESNLFPDLVLISVFLMVYGMQHWKYRYFTLGFGVLGFSAYAYGTSYLFLPLFLLPLLIYMIKTNKITFGKAFGSVCVSLIVALPIILFVVINTFDMEEISTSFITIPRLYVNRFDEIASVFSIDFIKVSLHNFLSSIKLLVLQMDSMEWNAIPGYGVIYIFSLPFTLIGLYWSFKPQKTYEQKERTNAMPAYIFNFWFIACLVLMFIVKPNINRINAVWIPWIYYTIVGITFVADKYKKAVKPILAVYMIAFAFFCTNYFGIYQKNFESTDSESIQQAIEYAEKADVDKVYMTKEVFVPYIYVLFYTQEDPNVFLETVTFTDQGEAFQIVGGFGKYIFSLPEEFVFEKDCLYIVLKDTMKYFEDYECKVVEFKNHNVVQILE